MTFAFRKFNSVALGLSYSITNEKLSLSTRYLILRVRAFSICKKFPLGKALGKSAFHLSQVPFEGAEEGGRSQTGYY